MAGRKRNHGIGAGDGPQRNSGSNSHKRQARKRKYCVDGISKIQNASKGEFIAHYDSLNLIKSPMDTNNYKVIRFPNQLKACLTSTLSLFHSVNSSYSSMNSNDPSKIIDLDFDTHSTMEVERFNEEFIHIKRNVAQELDPEDMSLLNRVFSYPWLSSTDDIVDGKDNWNARICDNYENWEPKEKLRKTGEISVGAGLNNEKQFGIAVCVTVGSLHDPPEFPGMAHLCEHCIFEGTSKYPNAWTLLLKNCSDINAFTGKERTVYHAKVDSLSKFKLVLSIFADMFQSPTLSQEIIKQEILSLDSETSMRQTNDVIRLYDLFTSLATDKHPLGRYHAGDQATLLKSRPKFSKKIVTSVRKWFRKYYHPSNLILSIQGPISMSQLILLTSQYFYAIPLNTPTNILSISPKNQLISFGYPFYDECLNKLYKINPFEDIQWLVITWVMSDQFYDSDNSCGPNICHCDDGENTKPLEYMSYLFNQKGRQSLYEYLWNQGFITNFSCCSSSANPCYSYVKSRLFSSLLIVLELTDEGLDHTYQIILIIYSFIQRLRKLGPKRRIFEEIRQKRANDFHYDREGCTDVTTVGISLHLNEDCPSLALTGSLVTKYDPRLIKRYLEALNPNNMNIMIVSKQFECEVTNIHPNIMTEYSAYYFNPTLLKDIENIRDSSFTCFDYPRRNAYIVADVCRPLELLENWDEGTRMRAEKCISYLHSSGKASLICYHKESDEGVPPKSIYTFMINSGFSPSVSAFNNVVVNLWVELFNEQVKMKYSETLTAGIDFGSSVTDSGIFIYIKGFSRFLPQLWLSILEEFLNFHPIPKRFEDYRKWLLKTCSNNCLDNLTLAHDLLLYITTRRYFPLLDLKEKLKAGGMISNPFV